MKNVTLAQGNQVLNLILQKDVPREQLQELLASGLLADLLDANVQQVDRVKFREVLGLSAFKYDKTKDGWKLLEDVSFDEKEFVPEFLELLKSGETSVSGGMMRLRAGELNAHTGQRHAEWLLAHRDRIPEELQGKCLVFPGTVWEDCDGNRRVPLFDYRGDGWYLGFCWVKGDWRGHIRIVRSRE